MGKSRRAKRLTKSTEDNKWDETPRRSYEDIIRENENFEKYYKLQKICPEEEWDTFIATMRENLPTAFRITGSKAEARALLRIVKSEFFKDFLNPNQQTKEDSSNEADDNVNKIHPISLPWYPDNLAWQLKLTRKDIRRSEAYFRLHNFLISETNSGNINRQEAVSMIPPLVLDVQPHHKVLDMCAAPGSKTSQLIEMLHADESALPSGYVIANDVDNNRCYMLVHQAKRLNSPCIIITNHDSAVMPNFYTNDGGQKSIVKFDRILCDVPCSGDGTLRKNADIWLKWNTANGNNLHGIQCRILQRGLEMLTVGGRIVYSTCSLNPIEDEAVIHTVLKKTKGSVQLVDISSKLPGLKYNPGMKYWVLTSREIESYKSFDEVPEKLRNQIRPHMFPPSTEEAEKFHFDRCVRILPHHQDTGGFFVAVLEKTDLLPWEAEKKNAPENNNGGTGEEVIKQNNDRECKEPQRKRRKFQGYKEDPFIFFDENEPLWPLIKDYYGISNELDPTCLLTRCKEGKKKNIYFASPSVRDILVNNNDKVKFINTGVKAFVRCYKNELGCSFRLAQEGLHSIMPYMGSKRKVPITKTDLIALLTCDDPNCPPEITTLSPKAQEYLQNIAQGSCILVYNEENPPDSSSPLILHMVGWRGKCSTRAYIATADCVHYLRLCGADVSKFDVNKFKNKQSSTCDEEETSLSNMEIDSEKSEAKEDVEEGENDCDETGKT